MLARPIKAIVALLLVAPGPGLAQAPPRSPQEETRCREIKLQGQRKEQEQGDKLWGIALVVPTDRRTGLLQHAELGSIRHARLPMQGATVEGPGLLPMLPSPGAAQDKIIGASLVGIDGKGAKVDLAICGMERDARDKEIIWYDVQLWDAAKSAWKNPCVGTEKVKFPRAMALSGIWNLSGAREDTAGKFTFACETGVLAKCVTWGYKPWAQRAGKSLRDYHQACTRMARADYCGNGDSYTVEGTSIDIEDGLGINKRGADPGAMSFEAAWGPDGAYCLDHTRHGQPLDKVTKSCPDRLAAGARQSLGQGDSCAVARPQAPAGAFLLRNLSRARP